MLLLKMPVVEVGDGQVKINGLIHDRHYSASLLSFYIKEESFYRAFFFDQCCLIRQKKSDISYLIF